MKDESPPQEEGPRCVNCGEEIRLDDKNWWVHVDTVCYGCQGAVGIAHPPAAVSAQVGETQAAKTNIARRLLTAHINANGDYKQAERLMLEVLRDEGVDLYE